MSENEARVTSTDEQNDPARIAEIEADIGRTRERIGGDLRTLGEPLFYRSKPEWAEAESKADYILGGTSIGVRKECPELLAAVNDALTAMDADGTRKKILEKYGAWADYQAKTTK